MWDLDYHDLFQFSIDNPEEYWDNVGKEIEWSTPYSKSIEDKHSPCPKWFVGGKLNMCYNCLDRQVNNGHGDEVAVIYDCIMTNTVERLTYKDLLSQVELLAGVLRQKYGVAKGDNVVLFFPRIPQCLIALLACARIGAVSVPIYAGSPVGELISYIKFTSPKVIITTNVGLEPGKVIDYKDRIDKAITESGYSVDHCIVYNRPGYPQAPLTEGRDFDWCSELSRSTPQAPVPVESNHPQYIIFTSGTTGLPKGIVRHTGGSVVTCHYTMKYLINLKPGQVCWTMSDLSWALGQILVSYAPLLSRNPTVLFEGRFIGTDDSSQILRVINQHNVASFFSIPTTMRQLRKFGTESDLLLTSDKLESIFIGGELSDASLKKWMNKTFRCAIYEIWGQTELGDFGIMPGQAMKGTDKYTHLNSTGLLMPSFNGHIVNRDTGIEVPKGEVGRFILKMPVGPSLLPTIYKDHDRCIKTYFSKYPGYYDTMDAAVILDNGAIKIVSRDDDVIVVGAWGVSSGALESACLKNKDVVNVAVVALKDEIEGFVPFAFLVPRNDTKSSDKEIINKTIELVNENIGDYACFTNVVIVPTLPRTRGGKIPRASLCQMLNGKKCEVLETTDHPEAYLLIYEELIQSGYKASKPIML